MRRSGPTLTISDFNDHAQKTDIVLLSKAVPNKKLFSLVFF